MSDHRSRDRVIVGFTITYAISAYTALCDIAGDLR